MKNWKDFEGPNPGIRIALLREDSSLSSGGTFAVMFMVLSAVVTIFAWIMDNSAIRQAAYGTVGTMLVVLFGICALIGRKHVYVVYREPPENDRGDAR